MDNTYYIIDGGDFIVRELDEIDDYEVFVYLDDEHNDDIYESFVFVMVENGKRIHLDNTDNVDIIYDTYMNALKMAERRRKIKKLIENGK